LAGKQGGDMEILIVILLVAVIGAVAFMFWESREGRRRMERQLENQRGELSQTMNITQQNLQQRIEGLDQRLTGSLNAVQQNMNQSLASTAETMKGVGETLGGLSQSAQRILEVGQDVSALHDILKPPKLRGGFGELLLENLLGQILAQSSFTIQYRFRNGEAVDAAIHLGNGLVPVDSKFPIESFRRLLDAQDDEERKAHRRAFIRDVKGHVDAVTKYIRPDEGTFDFALMYIPAENIYYETIVKDELEVGDGGLSAYAMEKKVVPVSPNSFYAYLQAIALGLKGMRVEERAQEIVGRLHRLDGDFKRLRRDFEILGGHIDHARGKYEDLDKGLGRFGDRLTRPLDADWSELPPPEEQPRLIEGVE
jgi:DNA recombination protein RmuC